MMTPRYSRSYINRVGDVIVDDNSTAEELKSALSTLNDWRALHMLPMNSMRGVLRNCADGVDPHAVVAQRLKRTPTIVDKLKNRQKSMDLGRMHDVGGLRAIVDSVQSVRMVEKNFIQSNTHALKRTYDYITEPRVSGYRGIHLVYEYQNPENIDCDGLLVEIQLRTQLQHLWSTAVETAGFVFQESLKSSQGNKQRLEFFQLVSALFAHEEEQPTSETFRQCTREELIDKLRLFEESNGVIPLLSAIHVISSDNLPIIDDVSGWLITTTLEPSEVTISPFDKKKQAMATWMYHVFENSDECKSGNMQVVLVSTDSIAKLRKAYPNFFLDIGDFVEKVQTLIIPSDIML